MVYILSVEEKCDRYVPIGCFTTQEKAVNRLDEYLASHGKTYRVHDCEGYGIGDNDIHLAQIFNDDDGFYADIVKMEVV